MEQKVSFKDSDGTNLVGIISNAKRRKDRPIVILAHGFSSSKDSKAYPTLAALLEDKDITSFRIDLYAHGESGGKFEDITVSKAVDSILSAHTYLKDSGYTQIGLLGASFGGISSIMASTKLTDTFALVLKCPVTNYEQKEIETKSEKELSEWKEKGYRMYQSSKDGEFKINYTMYQDFINNNGWQVAPNILTPTLIVHGDKDTTVPYQHSIKMSQSMPNCKLHIVKGANHHFDDSIHFQESNQLMVDFIVNNSS